MKTILLLPYARILNRLLRRYSRPTGTVAVSGDFQSSGYEHLSDRELVIYLEKYDGFHAVPPHILKKRGILKKDCSECGTYRMHYQHDYICITCRWAVDN